MKLRGAGSTVKDFRESISLKLFRKDLIEIQFVLKMKNKKRKVAAFADAAQSDGEKSIIKKKRFRR